MGGTFEPKPSVLVIDDSLFLLKFVHEMLKDMYETRLAKSANEAFNILKDHTPDLILLDLEMPQTNGYDVLEVLKENHRWKDIPVIFLTGANNREKEEKALDMGAVDYVLKPISKGVLKKRIHMHMELKRYQKSLQGLIEVKTRQLLHTQDLILDILANVTTYRDTDTGAHIIRTTNYSRLIAEKLLELQQPGYEISPVYARFIVQSAKLHDIGKIAIPDEILLKADRLSPAEFEAIKQHTVIGAEMIGRAADNNEDDTSFLNTAREIILYHHEWWNGEGYPKRLKGEEIPISARIMAIADVYDALISKRSYKEPLRHETAIEIMNRQAGTHFDTVLMNITSNIFPLFKEIAQAYRDD